MVTDTIKYGSVLMHLKYKHYNTNVNNIFKIYLYLLFIRNYFLN